MADGAHARDGVHRQPDVAAAGQRRPARMQAHAQARRDALSPLVLRDCLLGLDRAGERRSGRAKHGKELVGARVDLAAVAPSNGRAQDAAQDGANRSVLVAE